MVEPRHDEEDLRAQDQHETSAGEVQEDLQRHHRVDHRKAGLRRFPRLHVHHQRLGQHDPATQGPRARDGPHHREGGGREVGLQDGRQNVCRRGQVSDAQGGAGDGVIKLFFFFSLTIRQVWFVPDKNIFSLVLYL